MCGQREPAVHRGERMDRGMERKRYGEMVSCLITKQHSTVPTVRGPGRLSPGGRLMMLVWPAEGRPTQTSPTTVSARHGGKHGAPGHDCGRYTHTSTRKGRKIIDTCTDDTNHIHLLEPGCDLHSSPAHFKLRNYEPSAGESRCWPRNFMCVSVFDP